MPAQRIVSFLPSVTELLYELGAESLLQGVTHECRFPEDAKSKPRVITSVIDSDNLSSPQIDEKTCHLMSEGKEIFVLQKKTLKKANPDLIFSQTTCEVCAAHTNQVAQAIEILDKKPHIHSVDPHNLQEILNSVLDIAKLVGKEKQGKKLQESLKNRIQNIKKKIPQRKPNIVCIEWMKPFFTAGHWVPQMIELAGGQNKINKIGEHSRILDFDEIKNVEPDIIILMPCGFDTNKTISEYNQFLKDEKSWNSLKAVKNKNVFGVDANAFFSKPSIQTITGLEILAKIIHPEIFTDLVVPENSYRQIE